MTAGKIVYLDNSATTALSDAAQEAMTAAMQCYGNPSSTHTVGMRAAEMLKNAREQVAGALGVRNPAPGELIFTASGTEASNTALFGTVYAKARRTGHTILTTDAEHPSVENCMQRLEADGFRVVRIPTRDGLLDTEQALATLKAGDVTLVSMMMVNNELGARFDVERVFAAARAQDPAIVTHCDAVQGFLKCPFTVRSLGADLITVSAHKIHGPKGVGALYISPALIKAKKIVPYLIGGGQESGMRSGTENIIGIAGFGAAAAEGYAHLSEQIAAMQALRTYAIERLSAAGFALHLPRGACAPHILSVALPDIKSETMLNLLSREGICVSAGSACSSNHKGRHLSQSLLAFGISPAEADCTLRISLCPENTREDIDALTSALTANAARLVRIHR